MPTQRLRCLTKKQRLQLPEQEVLDIHLYSQSHEKLDLGSGTTWIYVDICKGSPKMALQWTAPPSPSLPRVASSHPVMWSDHRTGRTVSRTVTKIQPTLQFSTSWSCCALKSLDKNQRITSYQYLESQSNLQSSHHWGPRSRNTEKVG